MSNSPTPGNYDFSGPIPRHYDDYLGPMFFEPYAIEVAKRIDPKKISIVVELASGTGRVTRHLINVLNSTAKLIASDISEDMLSIAKEKLGNRNIEWRIIDAQELPFDTDSVDLIVCCFGYMFVPDKDKAFTEAHRVLRPGGMLLFTTWDKLESNLAALTYRSIVKKYLSDPLPQTYNLPFSMSDETDLKDLLNKAGFSNTSIEKLQTFSISSSAKKAAEGLSQGGTIYNEIMSRNPDWIPEIKDRLEKDLAKKFGEAPMKAPMSAVIVQAWK